MSTIKTHVELPEAPAKPAEPMLGASISENVKAGHLVTGITLNRVSSLREKRGTPILPREVEIASSTFNGSDTTKEEDLWSLEQCSESMPQTILLKVGAKPPKVGMHTVTIRAIYDEVDATHTRKVQINVLPVPQPGSSAARKPFLRRTAGV